MLTAFWNTQYDHLKVATPPQYTPLCKGKAKYIVLRIVGNGLQKCPPCRDFVR